MNALETALAMSDSDPKKAEVVEAAMHAAEAADERGARLGATDAARFVFAGNAKFTLRSLKTGARFTFRIRAKKGKKGIHFVEVLTGPDNCADFEFVGTVFDEKTFRHSRKSRIGADAPSVKAIGWALGWLAAGKEPPSCEVYHEGRCGRCGRPLTVPESIQMGLGPICAGG